MYAVVETGGKQFKVEKDQILKVEKIEAEKGDKVRLDVVMICDGSEVLAGEEAANAVVEAEVIGAGRFPKVDVFKYKAKKNERRHIGHRQPYTTLKILSVAK